MAVMVFAVWFQDKMCMAYIFDAVCAQRDAAAALVLPYINTKTVALHLLEISWAIPPGRHPLVILDQAGWHTTRKLPQPANLTLSSLPADFPELNPAEQVWQQLHERSLTSRC